MLEKTDLNVINEPCSCETVNSVNLEKHLVMTSGRIRKPLLNTLLRTELSHFQGPCKTGVFGLEMIVEPY